MWQGMKSVMVFDPKDTQQETEQNWVDWNFHNKSAVGDKAVMTAEETRAYLRQRERAI